MTGSSGGQNTMQTTQVQLSPEQQQMLNLAMPFAQTYAANQPQLPPGSSVAPFTPAQRVGQQATLNAVPTVAHEGANAAGAQDFLTSGRAFDPNSNPGLKAAITGAVQPIEENFSENIMPTIRSGAQTTGQFGGGREGALEGVATQAEQRAIGATAGQITNANYSNALDQMTKALGLTPTAQTAALEPGSAVSAVGDVEQQLEQQQLTEAFNRFMFPQTQPLATAESLIASASGAPGGSSSTTGTMNSTMNPLNTAVGLGSLGAALFGGSGIFGTSGAGTQLASMLPALFAV